MAKVSLVRCRGYGRDEVCGAVEKAVGLIGGIGAFVKRGTKVLVKPNLLSARLPEEAVDTHPEVVRAVVRLVKGAGATPLVGDSPGGFGANIEEIFDRSGMNAMAAEEDVELVKFTKSRFVDGIPFTRYLFECDAVISVPKFKTHGITVLTAAVKNMYGTVTGLYKAECHSRAPAEEDFARIIAKVYSIARPRLTVLDGITAMEGDGPSAGKPRDVSLIMAGDDAVAVDASLAKMMGLGPLDILVTKEASGMGLGEADLGKIEIAGESIDDFAMKDFKLPQTAAFKLIPKGIVNSIASMIRFRPHIDIDVCTRCNLCKITCPVNAIEIETDSCRIDYKKCVRCLCCHEVCPYKAISIKRNMLTKMVWG